MWGGAGSGVPGSSEASGGTGRPVAGPGGSLGFPRPVRVLAGDPGGEASARRGTGRTEQAEEREGCRGPRAWCRRFPAEVLEGGSVRSEGSPRAGGRKHPGASEGLSGLGSRCKGAAGATAGTAEGGAVPGERRR